MLQIPASTQKCPYAIDITLVGIFPALLPKNGNKKAPSLSLQCFMAHF